MDYIQFVAFLFFSIVSFFCTMYFSNEKLKESSNGGKFLKNTEWIIVKTLFSRAESTIHTDLKNASSVFKKATIGFVILALISGKLNLSISHYFFLIGGLSLFVWASLSWGRNPLKETVSYLKHFLLLVIGIVGLCFLMPNIEPIYILSERIALLGISSPFVLKLMVSLILILGIFFVYLLSCVIWVFFNSIFVGLFLLLSRLTALGANKIIGTTKGLSLYVFIISFISTLLAGSLFDRTLIFWWME